MITTTTSTATIMDHLWKATREKLLSGKNNFRNENDLLGPFVTFVFIPRSALTVRYAGTASPDECDEDERRRKIISLLHRPTVPSGSSSEWRIAY